MYLMNGNNIISLEIIMYHNKMIQLELVFFV